MSVMKPETQEAFDQYKELSSSRVLNAVRKLEKDYGFAPSELDEAYVDGYNKALRDVERVIKKANGI